MQDLISRVAAIDALVEEIAYKPEGYWDSGLNRYDVEVVLNQQPTVDAVEVVRCKDCRYMDRYGRCEIWECHKMPDMGFCHEGVKRRL